MGDKGPRDDGARLAGRSSRRRVLLWAGAAVVSVTGLGLAATRLVRSPQDVLADTKPPSRGVLLADVERRVLRDTVVSRGKVGSENTLDVTPSPRDGRPVVTGLRAKAGDTFGLGDVLVEVAGRPVVVLEGTTPAYRDLRPAMKGQDVSQLQASLSSMGFSPERDGTFGARTKQALLVWFAAFGYDVATTGDDDEARVAAAGKEVTNAARALTAAQEDLEMILVNPPAAQPGTPDPVGAARRRVQFAEEDLATAKQARFELERTTGPMLPVSEYVFLPALPGRVEKTSARIGTDVTAPLLTLSSGTLVVRGSVNPGQRQLLKVGMPVEIESSLDGTKAHGVLASIGELAQDESGARSHALLVTADKTPIDKALLGADVRLAVQAASTDGPVLVVPVSAVYADATGRSVILRLATDGSQVRVPVEVGVSGDGYVAVEPLGGGLEAGDRVIVGAETDS